MSEKQLIPAEECCSNYNIDIQFIHSLSEFDLIEITIQEEQIYLDESQLSVLEKYIRMHYELEINMAGIEAISHLLKRVTDMQQQMAKLHSRLSIYETV